MQTFVPYGSAFDANARALDLKRLGKQRVEGLQILKSNKAFYHGEKAGWQNHPATLMWRWHDAALMMYTLEMCDVWASYGYKDTVAPKLRGLDPRGFDAMVEYPEAVAMPVWLDDERVMLSHRSNLLRKHPDQYRRFWPDTPDNLDYYWPIQQKVHK